MISKRRQRLRFKKLNGGGRKRGSVLLRGKEKLWLQKLGERQLRESLLEGRGEPVGRELVGVGVLVGLESALHLPPLPHPPVVERGGGLGVEEELEEDLGLDEASRGEESDEEGVTGWCGELLNKFTGWGRSSIGCSFEGNGLFFILEGLVLLLFLWG